MDQARTITVDGIAYDLAQFSQGVQSAVAVYNTFQADLQREQLAVMKTQGALQTIGAQIGDTVKKELAEKQAGLTPDAADSVPAAQ